MMTIDDITSVYSKNLFTLVQDEFYINENGNDAKVNKAIFTSKNASFIVSGEDLFKADFLYEKQVEFFYFKKHCDGFVICSLNGCHYLIWVELKTGFNEVFNSAIYQISSCYVKAKSYLQCIDSYNSEDFEEFGIIVSRPDKKSINDIVLDRKESLVNPAEPSIIYKRRFRSTGKIILKGDDFGQKRIKLSPDVQLKSLPVVHLETNNQEATFDLLSIIKSVFP